MSRIPLTAPLMLAVALGGCATNLSGVGGSQAYACKAPVGALCTSVSGVYANAVHGMAVVPRPPQTPARAPSTEAPATKAADPVATTGTQATAQTADATATPVAAAPQTLRSSPRVLRLWIAPWEDADGDLHEGAIVHVVVDSGRWLVERVRPAARPRPDRVVPPAQPATAPAMPPAEPGTSSAPWQVPTGTPSPDPDVVTER